jgi:comEA protein
MKKHQLKRMKTNAFLILTIALLGLSSQAHVAQANPASVKLHVQKQNIALNQASAEELQQIKGIGPKLAQRIVEYRSTEGLFEIKEDLMDVKGIGQIKFNKIKDSIQI